MKARITVQNGYHAYPVGTLVNVHKQSITGSYETSNAEACVYLFGGGMEEPGEIEQYVPADQLEFI